MIKKFLLSLVLFVFMSGFSLAEEQDKLVVYYFYGKPRCVSCQKIENYTGAAVSENFSNPSVEYKMVDIDKPENKHYMKDYGLYTKSVVLSKIHEGKEIKYKNLDKIWLKLKDKDAFKKYIVDEINDFTGN